MARDGFKVFDSDMHVMEPPDLWERGIAPEFRSIAPRGVTSDSVRDLRLYFPPKPTPLGSFHSGRNFERNQKTYAEHARRGWGSDVQLEAMEAEGLDAAVLFPSRGLLVLTEPGLDPKFGRAIARTYNDWLFALCQADPKRMFGAAMVSVYDVNDAVEETHRAVEELGFKAIFLRSNIVNGKQWHDSYYAPLWDTLEKPDIPLGFHEASGSSSPQTGSFFTNFGIRRIFAQPVEQMLAMGSFIGGGVLARHPRLRVAFLEANCSWVPWLVWRMDESYELEGDLFMRELEMEPSAYFRRQCLVSVEPDELPVRHMLADFGSDQLVYSTDYPHGDSRYPHATDNFLKLPIPEADKRKILWDNCARFYAVGEVGAPAHR